MPADMAVFYKILETCLLIFIGLLVRRMHLLPENSLAVLGRYVLDVATPCLLATKLPSVVQADALARNWHLPILGLVLVAASDHLGGLCSRFGVPAGERITFRFVAAFGNWLYLALAVCEPVFGADGSRVVLLFNVGITLYVWSAGMLGFRKGIQGGMLRRMFWNGQIVATAIGLMLAIFFPGVSGLANLSGAALETLPVSIALISVLWTALTAVASTTIPLSLVQIGVRLAERGESGAGPACSRLSLWYSGVLRLVAAPALGVAILMLGQVLGLGLSRNEFLIAAIIAAMPTSVASLQAAEVYGGSTMLAARSILWTTLASMATVPAVTALARLAFAAVSG